MVIDYVINSIYKLTNQTMGARYGFPVVHDLQTGREYGPSDTLDSKSRMNPTLAKLLANIPSLTAGELVRRWRDECRESSRTLALDCHNSGNTDGLLYSDDDGGPCRTPAEIDAANLFLSQLGELVR